MNAIGIIQMVGGTAMFLYGMQVMSDGLNKSSSGALKRILERLTQNVFFGLLTGLAVTAVIQSSTATIVLAAGLVGAGVLTLKQSVGIVFGANIGTTITAQMIRLMDVQGGGVMEYFKPSTLAPIAITLGVILLMFIKRNGSNVTGMILVGFGVLFTGVIAMTSAVAPLADSPVFVNALEKFSKIPILGIITGIVTTTIVQSSSATVGMLQALSSTGVMTFALVYPVIMGINIGTCIPTAIMCSIGSSKDSKRLGVIHIVFNVTGTVLFMLAMMVVQKLGGLESLFSGMVTSGSIADFQTIFNLTTAAVMLPLAGLLEKLSRKIIKDEKMEDDPVPELHAPNDNLMLSPAVALSEAYRSIAAMGGLAHMNLKSSLSLYDDYDEASVERILTVEERLDRFTDETENYLVRLARNITSEKENRSVNALLQTMSGFERIGDYATNIQEFAEKLNADGLRFSETAMEELRMISSAVDEITSITTAAFLDDDAELAERVEPLEEVIDDMILLLKERHVERLKKGLCSVNAGLSFVETLTYLERASDQCSAIALLIIGKRDDEVALDRQKYLRLLHRGTNEKYAAEFAKRRDTYFMPLEAMTAADADTIPKRTETMDIYKKTDDGSESTEKKDRKKDKKKDKDKKPEKTPDKKDAKKHTDVDPDRKSDKKRDKKSDGND